MSRFSDERSGASALRDALRGSPTVGRPQLSNYPSLWRLFDGADASALGDMRERLSRTHDEFERSIRHGTSEEAERAARTSLAYRTALSLIEELEEVQRGGGGSL
jgi:hypothetical protein